MPRIRTRADEARLDLYTQWKRLRASDRHFASKEDVIEGSGTFKDALYHLTPGDIASISDADAISLAEHDPGLDGRLLTAESIMHAVPGFVDDDIFFTETIAHLFADGADNDGTPPSSVDEMRSSANEPISKARGNRLPPVSDAKLDRWWAERRANPANHSATIPEDWNSAREAFPENSVARDRVVVRRGRQTPGPKPFRDKVTGEFTDK